jgi:Sulfatase
VESALWLSLPREDAHEFDWKKALVVTVLLAVMGLAASPPATAQQRPNIVMLMTDDAGWNDFGAYSGGGMFLGHPTPNIDRLANEGAVFTNWYGQASCTAGRASFLSGRIPIRSALSIVVAPGDPRTDGRLCGRLYQGARQER